MAEGQGESVTFKCRTNDDWPVFVLGNVREMGSWSPDGALPLQSHDSHPQGHDWNVQVHLQHGVTVEYKFIKKAANGTIWESGENRRYTVIPGPHTISDSFRE